MRQGRKKDIISPITQRICANYYLQWKGQNSKKPKKCIQRYASPMRIDVSENKIICK